MTAEFDNYRKRIERERREATERAAEAVLGDLLPILDDLERALAADTGEASAESYRRGVELIHRQTLDLLTRRGVKPIETVGPDFDPNLHQAVASESVPGVPRRRDCRGAAARVPARRPAASTRDGEGGAGVSKRDYYEVLGVARHAAESELKICLPEARAAAPSGSQSRRQGRGRTLQGSRRGLRGALGSAEARGATTGSATPASAAASGGIDPSTFVGFEDILGGLGDVFGLGDLFGGGRRRGGPQQGSHLRYDLEISFEEAARGTETSIQFPRAESCEVCRGSGAAAGSGPTACPTCGGRGQLRYQQGFFTVARTCSQCRGTGQIIAKPCAVCHGEGRVMKDRKLTVKIPAGIDTGQRLRIQGEGEHGVQNGPPGDLYVVVQVQDHAFFRREGNDLYCEMPLHFPTLALGGEIKVATLLGEPEPLKVPEGTATGTHVPSARQGAAGRVGPREGRPVRHRPRDDAEEVDEGAAPAARVARQVAAAREVRAAPQRRDARRQEHLRSREGHLRLT